VSYQDLRNAGLATVSTVIVLSPKQTEGTSPLSSSYNSSNTSSSSDASARQREMTEVEETRLTVDGEVIVSFVKMSDGLLRPGAQVILELQHEVLSLLLLTTFWWSSSTGTVVMLHHASCQL
jgi:hypothetical protein